jgi:diadenosine tetraphosphate (Ap4A) HIT family hydrolase
MTFVEVDHARTEEQKKVLQEIEASGECPFCMPNLHKHHDRPILYGNKHWIATENQWPYKNIGYHFLVIPRVHAESLNDLPAAAGIELLAILQHLESTFKLDSGAVLMRFGDTTYNGGSVKHLHVHLMVPDLQEDWSEVRVKIGSRPK